MNIIDFRKICFDKHNRAYFLRVQPDDLKVTLSQIFYVLSDLSWISNFDEDYIRESFQERAKATLADIYAKITTSSTDEVSSDAGEYVVSELAREAIVDKLGYLDIPLAELYNKKKSGNPGFDFHSQSLDEVIIFGEAKYLDDRNAYAKHCKLINWSKQNSILICILFDISGKQFSFMSRCINALEQIVQIGNVSFGIK